MNVRLPAAAPKNPLTTPEIKAKPLKNDKLTFSLYLILEIQ